MAGIITPKTYVKEIKDPLIFLAGPIKGAPKWHDEAIDILLSLESRIVIASPKKELDDKSSVHMLKGEDGYFSRQRAWERHYLDIASKKGCIMFWLPGEIEHRCEKSYGAMTRVDLHQWMIRYSQDNFVRLCIGSDGSFSELDTIIYNISKYAPEKKMTNTLRETCEQALMLARYS